MWTASLIFDYNISSCNSDIDYDNGNNIIGNIYSKDKGHTSIE